MRAAVAIAGILGLWVVDLSAAMSGYLCNGFFCVEQAKAFHVGLYLAIACIGFLAWRHDV